MMLPRRSLVAVVCLLALAGCSVPGGTGAPGGSGGGGSGTPSAAVGSVAPSHDSRASESGVDASSPPPVVGSVHVACTTSSVLEKVTIGVLGVQRRDKVAVATFVATAVKRTVIPPPADNLDDQAPSLYKCNQAAWDPVLVDGANLVAYTPIQYRTSEWLRTPPSEVALAESPTYLYAVFPAPKEGVTTVDVVVGAGTVTGVPVT